MISELKNSCNELYLTCSKCFSEKMWIVVAKIYFGYYYYYGYQVQFMLILTSTLFRFIFIKNICIPQNQNHVLYIYCQTTWTNFKKDYKFTAMKILHTCQHIIQNNVNKFILVLSITKRHCLFPKMVMAFYTHTK